MRLMRTVPMIVLVRVLLHLALMPRVPPPRFYAIGYGWNDWYSGSGRRFWADQLDVRTVQSFEAQAEILLLRGAVPAGEQRAVDARKVITELVPAIERPKPSSR